MTDTERLYFKLGYRMGVSHVQSRVFEIALAEIHLDTAGVNSRVQTISNVPGEKQREMLEKTMMMVIDDDCK